MDIPVKELKNFQSIEMVCTSPKNPMSEFMAMMKREVPTAFFMGNFANKTNDGIIKKPPPAPTNPMIIPIVNVWISNVNNEKLPTVSSVVFFFFNIEIAAKTIIHAKNTIKKSLLVTKNGSSIRGEGISGTINRLVKYTAIKEGIANR